MLKINYEQTKVLTKKHLDTLTKYIKAGYYQIKKVPLYEIDEDTDFMDLLTINCSTPYDDVLNMISKFYREWMFYQSRYCTAYIYFA